MTKTMKKPSCAAKAKSTSLEERSLEKPLAGKRPRKVLSSTEEFSLYLSSLSKVLGFVHFLMGALRTATGARPSQVRLLRRHHLDLDSGKCFMIPMKRGVGQWVQLPSDLVDAWGLVVPYLCTYSSLLFVTLSGAAQCDITMCIV